MCDTQEDGPSPRLDLDCADGARAAGSEETASQACALSGEVGKRAAGDGEDGKPQACRSEDAPPVARRLESVQLVPLLLVEAKEGATAAAQSTETSASATPAEETGNGSARDDFVKTMLRRKLESAEQLRNGDQEG